MNNENVLNDLQARSNSLKFRLVHEQLKYGNYSFEYFMKYSKLILNEYKHHKSLFKASSVVGVDYKIVRHWYVQGQLNNPRFRGFYLSINEYNNDSGSAGEIKDDVEIEENVNGIEGEYVISQYGDGWSYKTYVDGEKIFLISADLKTLKKKVKDKHLPLD